MKKIIINTIILSMLLPMAMMILKVNANQKIITINGFDILSIHLIAVIILVFPFFMMIKKIASSTKKPKEKMIIIEPFTFQFRSINQKLITVSNPFRGLYIQGGAGSGKTDSLFKPIIKQFSSMNISGILYDFKNPELSELAYNYYQDNQSVNFAIINFKDIQKSNRVNPISPKHLTKTAFAFEIAQAFIYNLLPENIKQQDYWGRSSISLTAGIIWYLKKHYPKYCTIPHLITFILNCPAEKMVEIISQDNETAGMIASLKEALEQKAGKQIAGVLGTLKNAVAPLNIKEVFYLLSKDEVNLDLNNRNKPTLLAIGNDSSLPGTYDALISIIVTISSKLMNQPDKWQSTITLDEGPTLYIPNFEQIPATGRSNKIITVYGAQDFTQIIDKYGKDKADALISNLGNQFFGRTVNAKTAKMISDIFDKEDRYFTSHSTGHSKSTKFLGGGSSSSNTSTSVQERNRAPIGKIKRTKPGQFYAIVAEGNYEEWLGVQLDRQEFESKPLPIINNNINLEKIYNQIHADINIVIKNEKTYSDDFEKKKEKSIDISIKDSNDDINEFFN